MKPKRGSKRSEPEEPVAVDQEQQKRNTTATIEVLRKIFPKLKCSYLQQTLATCNEDVLKTIEVLIKEQNEVESNSDSDGLVARVEIEQPKLPIRIPFETDFNEIRKQFGFNKKKPKNSFVRHKAQYENQLREQASKVVKPAGIEQNGTDIGSIDSLVHSFKPQPPQPPSQQLLSMFSSPVMASEANSGHNTTFAPSVTTESPSTSPASGGTLLGTCPVPNHRLMNARNMMLNPSLLMPNPASFLGTSPQQQQQPQLHNDKADLDSKLTSNPFLPVSSASSMSHLSPRNLFDSLVASSNYRNLFPAFFPGTSLGLLGAGLPGLGMNTEPSNNLHPGLPSFEQNFDEFNQKLTSQRTHQLQSALNNICGNSGSWYGIGTASGATEMLRGNSKCEDKTD